MLKKFMITTALTGAIVGTAAAQTPPTMQQEVERPASASAGVPSRGNFINAQSGEQWLSSSFIGTDVVGPDNEKIGDIADVLFEKNGNVVAYVVGVGGFLGIGTKNVALAPSSFQVMPAGTGTTGSMSATAPEDIKLKLNMTKDQLKQAAAFESRRDHEARNRAPAQPNPGGMNRPAPAPR